jgi:hypothetical protein
MDRRELIRALGLGAAATALAGISPERLLALGRKAHTRATIGEWSLFTPRQGELATTIADAIIPTTDTPGARAAGVGPFIDFMVDQTFDAEELDRFLAGLDEIDSRSLRTVGATFLDATDAQRNSVLATMEVEAVALRLEDDDSPPPFFTMIKELTLFGYYTSEVGMTEELGWRMIPGSYDGCVDLMQPRPGGF